MLKTVVYQDTQVLLCIPFSVSFKTKITTHHYYIVMITLLNNLIFLKFNYFEVPVRGRTARNFEWNNKYMYMCNALIRNFLLSVSKLFQILNSNSKL